MQTIFTRSKLVWDDNWEKKVDVMLGTVKVGEGFDALLVVNFCEEQQQKWLSDRIILFWNRTSTANCSDIQISGEIFWKHFTEPKF